MDDTMTGEQHERAVEATISHRLTSQGHCPYCSPHGTIEEGPPGATWTVECEHGGVRQQATRYIDAYHRSLREQGVVLVDLREVTASLRAMAVSSPIPAIAAKLREAADAIERRFGGNESQRQFDAQADIFDRSHGFGGNERSE